MDGSLQGMGRVHAGTRTRSTRQLAHHPFHQPVHLQDLCIAQRLACSNPLLPLVVARGLACAEGQERARSNGLCAFSTSCCTAAGTRVPKVTDADHLLAHAAPEVGTLPGAVGCSANALGVVAPHWCVTATICASGPIRPHVGW